jgi:hypothetical protein
MGMRSRVGLLMLTALLGGNTPPYPPPGSPPPGSSRVATCPDCKRKSISRAGGRFFCENCGRYFTPERPAGTQAS